MGLTGFGFGEVLLIAMLVLIVFGPKRLPEVTRTIGKGIREFKKGMNEIQRELEAAGRETSWEAPPPPPPTTAATAAAGTATIAGPDIGPKSAEEGDAEADESDEGASDESASSVTDSDEGASDATASDATASEATPSDDGASEAVTEEQAPPSVPSEPDPAEAYIDPWSTDSSRPTFDPAPRAEEPVIASPPEPVPVEPETEAQQDEGSDEADRS